MKEKQRKVQSTHDQCRKRITDVPEAGSEAPVGDVVMQADLRTSGPRFVSHSPNPTLDPSPRTLYSSPVECFSRPPSD